jgi:multisubunit Na+/H+ antiporter MnhC subunit
MHELAIGLLLLSAAALVSSLTYGYIQQKPINVSPSVESANETVSETVQMIPQKTFLAIVFSATAFAGSLCFAMWVA